MKPWDAKKIQYIKLGASGKWAEKCFADGTIRLGFSSGLPKLYKLATQGQWDQVRDYWKKDGYKPGVATGFANQMKEFFEDDGSTLWITIENGFMYYGFSDGNAIKTAKDDGFPDTSYRLMSKNGWSNQDRKGNFLRTD